MTAASDWIVALPPFIAAVSVLWLPGLLATSALRLPLVARVALSTAVSVTSIGVAGVVFGALGMPFAAWQILVPAAVLGAVVWALRSRLRGAGVPASSASWWWLLASWLGATLLIAFVAFAAVPTPERISQTYDNVFHLSAIAHILDAGDASSLTLRTLIETDKTWSFYPAGWHTLVATTVQLTGASVPVAVNAGWAAVCAAVWLPGVAWLAQVILRGHRQRVVALAALPLGAAFASMPYGLLTWGTLYPTFLATALLPVAVAAPLAAWRRSGVAGDRAAVSIVVGAFGAVIALVAIAFSQPRVLVTWAVLIVPFAAAEAVRIFRRARRAGGRSRRIATGVLWGSVGAAVLIAAAGFAYLVFRLGLFDRPLDDRLGGPQAQATQTVWEGLWQVVSQSWPLGVGAAVTFPALLVALAVLIGLVTAGRTRGMRWIPVSYAVFAVLFALAAGSDDVTAKLLTALWYKDRYRLDSALPVLGVALATLGILVLTRRITRARAGTAVAIGAAWVATITAVIGFGSVTTTASFVFRMPDRAAVSEVVSQAQIDFMADLAEVVPADQRLLGDPWDGSALSQLYAGREPVFPHVNGQWDAGRATLAWRLQDIDTDPAVCAALDALRVRYVLYHPHEFGGGDPAGNHFIGVHSAVEAGLLTEVATDGDSTLYRIDQCGPLPG